MKRRAFLQSGSVGAVVGLGSCLGEVPGVRFGVPRESDEGASTPTTATSSTGETGPTSTAATTTSDASSHLARFRRKLREADVGVESLTVDGGRAFLTYVSADPKPHEVAAEVERITTAYVEVVDSGWDVDALEATLVGDDGRTRGYWRVPTDRVEAFFAGELTQTELLRRTLDTFRGDIGLGEVAGGHHDDDHRGDSTADHRDDSTADNSTDDDHQTDDGRTRDD